MSAVAVPAGTPMPSRFALAKEALAARGGIVLLAGRAVRLPDGAARDDPRPQRRGTRRRVRRDRQLRPVRPVAGAGAVHLEHADLRGLDDAGHRSARVPVRLRDAAQLHPVQGAVAQHRDDPDPRAVAAGRDLVHLPVRQPGRVQVHARVGRAEVDLRHAGHGDGDDLRLVPARRDDPDGGARAVGRAALRGRRLDGNERGPQVHDDHAAGREVRPDLREHGRLHDGGLGVRRAEGDRRQHQRAGGRHLQAGDRPAELLDGRGRRARAAAAGGGRVRDRPHRAAQAAGAADRAQRAVPGRSRRAGATGRCCCWSCSCRR